VCGGEDGEGSGEGITGVRAVQGCVYVLGSSLRPYRHILYCTVTQLRTDSSNETLLLTLELSLIPIARSRWISIAYGRGEATAAEQPATKISPSAA